VTSFERAEAVAQAVLYEGYMLYPYRPSSVKNRQRWTFGGIFPRDCAARDASLLSVMRTECLVEGGPVAAIDVRVRFLHLLKREVGRLDQPLAAFPVGSEPPFTLVPSLSLGDRSFHAWEEATERTVTADALTLDELVSARVLVPFRFAGRRDLEPLRAPDAAIAGVLIRSAQPVEGALVISAKEVAGHVYRLTVDIENTTPLARMEELSSNGAQQRAFASAHTMLRAQNGAFSP